MIMENTLPILVNNFKFLNLRWTKFSMLVAMNFSVQLYGPIFNADGDIAALLLAS